MSGLLFYYQHDYIQITHQLQFTPFNIYLHNIDYLDIVARYIIQSGKSNNDRFINDTLERRERE